MVRTAAKVVVVVMQAAEAVAAQVQQQEVQWCKGIAASGTPNSPAQKLYVDMVLKREDQEASTHLSAAQTAALNRSAGDSR